MAATKGKVKSAEPEQKENTIEVDLWPHVEIGDLVRNITTGREGVVFAVTSWLFNCRSICVKPLGTDAMGLEYREANVDEPLLVVVQKGYIKPNYDFTSPAPPTGGPDHGSMRAH